MPSDQQISILFEIASNGGGGLASNKLPDLMDLVANGYVEAGDGGEFYKLTAKGQDLLSKRGGGANESQIDALNDGGRVCFLRTAPMPAARSRFVADLLAFSAGRSLPVQAHIRS